MYPWGGFNSDGRRPVSYGFWVNMNYGDEGRTRGASLNPYLSLRFSTRMQATIGPNVFWGKDNTQWFGNFTDASNVMHYTFAHLNQHQVSLSTRIDYALTKDLTFAFYGQPFVATGVYTNIRETSATPRATAYDARFRPFIAPAGTDTAFKTIQLRSNAVLRWEYRPGSTLFLVWTHGREDDTNQYSDRPWMADYSDLFRIHPTNTFLIKLAYWMNR
jgi:hypothetical protein